MKYLSLLILTLWSCSQINNKAYTAEIETFQTELNEEYLDKEETPLRGDIFDNFERHPFFPINKKYRVEAKFERFSAAEPFEMPTSSGKTQTYLAYAKATFTLEGEKHSLIVYQNQRLKDMPEYKDHLFLPFYDETNDVETYAGGRYLDLTRTDASTIIIDFNKAYQPYCAYNIYDYSCPIVPSKNRLDIRIPAGVKYNKEEFKNQ